MKRLFVLVVGCFILLTGCGQDTETTQKPAQTNKFGTQSVEIARSVASAPDDSVPERDTGAGNSPASSGAEIVAPASGSGISEEDDASSPAVKDDSEASVAAPDNTVTADNNIPPAASAVSADVEIKEKMFLAQVSDIYVNAEDYLGKTIKYEGIFDVYTWEEENLTYCSVIRYGPGCCGNDGNAGFEVSWSGKYPKQNDWVEAVGVLETYEEDGWEYLRLNLTSLTVLPTRGAEFVSQ